jgi:heam-based aerotactic trancducer
MWSWARKASTSITTNAAPVEVKPEAGPEGSVQIHDPIWGNQARFIGLDATVSGIVAGLGDEFDPGAVIDRFFEKVTAEPELQGIIGRHSTEQRLKTAWTAHWRELTSGKVDDAYVQRRLQIGQTHVRVGLGQSWYLGAYVWVFDELLRAIRRRYGADPEQFMQAADAAFRMVAFDMQTGVEAYIQGVLHQRDEREADLVRLQHEAQTRAEEAHGMRERMVESATPLAAVAEELAAQVEEMRTGVQRVAAAADSFSQNAREAVDRSATGQQRASEAAEVVAATTAAVDGVGQAMAEVEGSVQQIEQFANVIDALAGQTNLLALNAAIEAARAGTHGRGFGVVAGEMRRLADRTQAALGEIRKLAQEARTSVASASGRAIEVTAASDRARVAVADAVGEFRGITAVTDQSLQGFRTVAGNLNELAEMLGEIARASDVVSGQASGLASADGRTAAS